MRRLLAITMAIALTTAACGDDTALPASSSTSATTTAASTSPTTSRTTSSTATTSAPTTAAPGQTTTAAPTTTAATTTTTTVPTTEHPGLPPASSRSLIPFDAIDQGWVAAVYSADGAGNSDQGPTVLYLADPNGNLYEVASYPAGDSRPYQVGNLSNDGTHVVAAFSNPDSFDTTVAAVDVATGTRTDILTAESGPWIGTTLPTGRDVVVARTTFNPTTEHLDVYRTDGSLFAAIDSRPSFYPGYSWLYGLDGTFLIVGAGNGLAVYGNDGTLRRMLDTPADLCEPVRWWDAATVLAGCVPDNVAAANGYYHVLWRIPLDGSPGTPLTAPPPANWQIVDFGYRDARRVGGETMLQWWGDCGARAIHLLQTDGTGASLPVEPPGGDWIVVAAGDGAVIHSTQGCGDEYGPVRLIRPDGSLIRTLIPQVPGFQGVISVAGMIPTP